MAVTFCAGQCPRAAHGGVRSPCSAGWMGSGGWVQERVRTAKPIPLPSSPCSLDKHRNAITRTLAAPGLNTLMAENESAKTAQITLTRPLAGTSFDCCLCITLQPGAKLAWELTASCPAWCTRQAVPPQEKEWDITWVLTKLLNSIP